MRWQTRMPRPAAPLPSWAGIEHLVIEAGAGLGLGLGAVINSNAAALHFQLLRQLHCMTRQQCHNGPSGLPPGRTASRHLATHTWQRPRPMHRARTLPKTAKRVLERTFLPLGFYL